MKTTIVLTTLVSFFLTSCCSVRHQRNQMVGISSNPTGATIIVDGVPQGVTPKKVPMQRDQSHQLILMKEGYFPKEYQLQSKVSAKALSSNALFPLGFACAGLTTLLVMSGGSLGGWAVLGLFPLVTVPFLVGAAVGGAGCGVDVYSGKAYKLHPQLIHATLQPM